MTAILPHPSLGKLRGIAREDVIQFLGLKYATLSDRFAPSKLFNGWAKNAQIDLTKYGPCAPAPAACDISFNLIQASLPKPTLTTSDTDCLNLNITIPELRRDPDNHGWFLPTFRDLPVVVFIHGGSFTVGSASWPQYDLARLVRLARDIGSPIIGVGVNYRLGALGFLTSAELRKAGYRPNNGLQDMITALKWVKRHIAGFGGNPENINLLGQGTGAAAGCFLLHHREPLFQRFINMSGTSLNLHPLPLSVAEKVYSNIIRAFGFDDETPADQIKILSNIPVENFVRLPSSLPLMPVVDDDLIPRALTFEEIFNKSTEFEVVLPGLEWCEALMIGDCQFDGMIFTRTLRTHLPSIAPRFIKSIEDRLAHKPNAASTLLSAYKMNSSTPEREAISSILNFVTDICFYAPTIAWSRAFSATGKTFLYHFNVPNPWPGAYQGEAAHMLDLVFCFMNFEQLLDETDKSVGRKLAADVVHFVIGDEPWKKFERSDREGAMIYDTRQNSPEKRAEYKHAKNAVKESQKFGRRNLVFDICARKGAKLDDLYSAWISFLTGP